MSHFPHRSPAACSTRRPSTSMCTPTRTTSSEIRHCNSRRRPRRTVLRRTWRNCPARIGNCCEKRSKISSTTPRRCGRSALLRRRSNSYNLSRNSLLVLAGWGIS
ncbi:unnamed protein product [Amoebophrya sp. A120]|nr:unnamed protein product [Amoebophrya sp. A120]|eukprot:GSA120T00016264001.1